MATNLFIPAIKWRLYTQNRVASRHKVSGINIKYKHIFILNSKKIPCWLRNHKVNSSSGSCIHAWSCNTWWYKMSFLIKVRIYANLNIKLVYRMWKFKSAWSSWSIVYLKIFRSCWSFINLKLAWSTWSIINLETIWTRWHIIYSKIVGCSTSIVDFKSFRASTSIVNLKLIRSSTPIIDLKLIRSSTPIINLELIRMATSIIDLKLIRGSTPFICILTEINILGFL